MAAASASVVGPAPERLAVWNRFRSLSQQRIQEGNVVAGERLWTLVDAAAGVPGFTIVHAGCSEDSVVCSLDLASWTLTCTPGPTAGCAALTFALTGRSRIRLRHEGRERTLDEAVTLILDALVRTYGPAETEAEDRCS